MKYRDLFSENPSYWRGEMPEPKCLAWSANHEHAVFSLDDSIHPQAKFVWIKPSGTPFILCYEKRDYCKIFQPASGYKSATWVYHEYQTPRWIFVELKLGEIPLENNNPFDPRKQNCASNTAESVFPQNQWKG